MNNNELMTEPIALHGDKLWDEIFKAIVSAMPSQLFPLFREVYGRDYPKDTPVVLLGSEISSFQENDNAPPTSTLMDIALLVADTDYYHLECQMKNDKEMVIRMFFYDVRFATTHTKTVDEESGEIMLYVPRSIVIYPEKNKAIPDYLKCRVVFQDNSEHIYQIPTVKIQTYSLEEIHKKHLDLFIPYTILRLRPKLKNGVKHPLSEKELTEFVENVILILNKELSDGFLTKREYDDYVRLFRFAVNKVLANHPQMREEVHRMTEPLIKLPSMIIRELETELADQKKLIADQATEIADQAAEIADQAAEIQRLQELLNQRSSCSPTP